jgi:copper chaperone NosL
MSKLTFAFVVVALLSTGCSVSADGPPQIVVDRTACSHCSMLVSEPIYAAAYQAGDSEPRVFDDIGCMLDAVRRESASPLTLWLQDAGGSGWMAAADAVVVASPQLRTPMGGGLLAYADAGAAEKAAAANGGRVLRSLPELMAWHGDTK